MATQAVGKSVAKKVLGRKMAQSIKGSNDPYYEYYEDPRTGKVRRERRRIPSYIPEHDAKILHDVRKRAERLDEGFNLCGLRVGVGAGIVVGLIPGVGDVIVSAKAYGLYRKCKKVHCGLDNTTDKSMLALVVLDGVIGLVPVVGDLIDAGLKPNTRNLKLLIKRLDDVYMPDEERARRGLSPRKQKVDGNGSKRQQNVDGNDYERQPTQAQGPPPKHATYDDDHSHPSDVGRKPEDRMIENGQPRKRSLWRRDSRNQPQMSGGKPALPQRSINGSGQPVANH